MKRRYCTGLGWLSPSRFSIWATVCRVAYLPAISAAGLPGTAKKITNVVALTIRSTTTLQSRRRTT